MGQQQLVLLVLGVVLVSVAIMVGVSLFSIGSAEAERDALVIDANRISNSAAAFWRRPSALGGGNRSFAGLNSVVMLGWRADSNDVGVYTISDASTTAFTVTGIGRNTGVYVRAVISNRGITELQWMIPPEAWAPVE